MARKKSYGCFSSEVTSRSILRAIQARRHYMLPFSMITKEWYNYSSNGTMPLSTRSLEVAELFF